MAETRKRTDAANLESTDLGYYRRTSLDDIINNFVIMYVGQDKILSKVPRLEVAAVAQRAVQEFSYDVFHAENNMELELGPALTVPLPADYVNFVEVSSVDQNGVTRPLTRTTRTNPSKAALQDQDYNVITDSNGDIVFADESEQNKRFQSPQSYTTEEIIERNSNYITDNNYSYYNGTYFGRQWGINPADANINGTFLLDEGVGIMYLDSTFQEGDLINLRYISDGIGANDDLRNVFVPKMAEDAVYANMLYNLAKVRPSAAGAAGLYKKEAKSKLNNAKIRLMQIKTNEIEKVLRNKAKWIKH